MNTKPLSQNAIGRQLGLAPATMTKMRKQGCPMESVESVRAWRTQYQNPAYSKPEPYRPAPVAQQHIARAETCMRAAAAMLREGVPLEVFAPTLRAAMAAVPLTERAAVGLDRDVMEWLLAPLLALPGVTKSKQAAGEMPDDGADDAGSILYGLACGELVLHPP